MFCPKCSTENPDNSKFCRSCRANLSNVLAAMEGRISSDDIIVDNKNSYKHLYTTGIRNVILGMGFLVTGIFVKTMPGDTNFWIFFMIPAIILLASGIPRIIKAEEVKKEKEIPAEIIPQRNFPQNQQNQILPPAQSEYISPQSNFKTKELVVPSVTEDTTRQLKTEQ